MSEPGAGETVEALIDAADDQATTEARTDARAVVRFYRELIDGDIPTALADRLTGDWLAAYLDTCDDD